jgi:predicted transcriptional regulator
MAVNQILDVKGRSLYSILSGITVYEALRVMREKNVGALLIVEGNVLKCVISEWDYARKIALENKSSR